MFDEIEKFLKQAAEAAQQDQQRRANEARRRTSQQQQRGQKPPPPRPLPQAEVVDAELADISSLSGIERDFRGTQEIAEHTRRLGSEVVQQDQSMQAHLHQTFDHQVGTLKSGRGVTDVGPTRAAGDSMDAARSILRMIASPDGIRDAIILGEVLRRPEERWE